MAMMCALLATASVAAPAMADDDDDDAPTVRAVSINGNPSVGGMLIADTRVTGAPAPTLAYEWRRCAPRPPRHCAIVSGDAAYTVGPADAGHEIRVTVTASNASGSDAKRSEPVLIAEPTAPAPSAPPPAPAPPPPAPVVVAPPPAATPASPRLPRLMTPFPVVRYRGSLAAGGVRLDLFRISAPRGASITVVCAGQGCPARSSARRPKSGRVRALERFLPAGIRITVRVSRPGRIGKHVRIAVRRGKPPARRDRCLLPGSTRAVKCPAR
jgi:hypothetical protein